MNKMCPECRRQYPERYNYCSKCAVKLVKNKNHCSDPKSTACEHIVYEDDDIVCAYCGAVTTYEKERLAKME